MWACNTVRHANSFVIVSVCTRILRGIIRVPRISPDIYRVDIRSIP